MTLRVTAFLAGIVAFQYQSQLPVFAWACLVFLLPFAWKKPAPIQWLAVGLAGWLWAFVHAVIILTPQLDTALSGNDLLVEGIVTGLPKKVSRGERFEFRVARIYDGLSWQNLAFKVQLNWYRHGQALQAGDKWRLVVRLKPPHGFRNPGGFDYERWLFQHRLRATGYVRKDARNRNIGAGSFARLSKIRQQLSTRIQQVLAGRPNGGVVRALVTGDRSDITTHQWRSLQTTGTSHLLAISGLHIGLLAGWVYFLGVRIWRLTGLAQRIPAPQASALASILAAGLYAALAGFSLPTQRAFIMVATTMLALILGFRMQPLRLLITALWVILIIDPLAVLSNGFWLSFSAVAALIYLSQGRSGAQTIWIRWTRFQIGLLIALAPVLIMNLLPVAVLAPLANLLAIPWIGMVIVPLSFLGALLLPISESASTALFQLAEVLLGCLWPVLNLLGKVPMMLWHQPAPALIFLLLALPGCLWLLAPRGWKAPWLGIILLLPMISSRIPSPEVGAAWVTLLDVGQGLATVVRTRNHTLVYDTGARFSERFNAGSAVVVPFLHHNSIRKIDRLIISHGDNDHAGGIQGLLDDIPVSEILAGVPAALIPVSARPCNSGQSWVWDDVKFELLYPPAQHKYTGNNASCVLRVESIAGTSILLTGDIEFQAEDQLVRNYGHRLASTAIVAPHHGSATSSSQSFLEKVKPAYVLFPSGYRNRWGFPRPDVVDRYRALEARAYNTANSGAITIRLPAAGSLPIPERYRHLTSRYWHSR